MSKRLVLVALGDGVAAEVRSAVSDALAAAGVELADSDALAEDVRASLAEAGATGLALVSVAEAEAEADGEEHPPKPSGSLGRLGRPTLTSVVAEHNPDPKSAPPKEEAEELPASGWKRAVFEIEGEVVFDRREDLPQPIEKLAPLMDVLHTAGQTAVLKRAGRLRYSLWGWPDLQRPTSKVLAVGWGDPLAEVVALHRFPVQTGTCIEGAHGLLPKADTDIATVAEAVTGRAPKDTSGKLFAIQGDTIYVRRGGAVYSWDGRKERNEGTERQVLASLVLRWSNR
jgi:hypothetical protein